MYSFGVQGQTQDFYEGGRAPLMVAELAGEVNKF